MALPAALPDALSNALPTVMLLNGRGDYLLNLPALRAFAGLFEARWTLVAMKDAHRLILPELPVARVLEPAFEKSARGPEFDAAALAEEIGETPAFVSLNPWHTDSMTALLRTLRAGITVGYDAAFDLEIPLDFSKHSMDLAFDAVRAFRPEERLERHVAPPRFAEPHEALARSIVSQLPAGATLVGLHGETLPRKMWGEARFSELVRGLWRRLPEALVLDLGLAPAVAPAVAADPRYLHLAQLILPAAFALVRRLDCFVGVDSCFLHAADFYRVPSVGLFGPTDVHEFGLRLGGPGRHVSAPSMEEIAPARVLEALEELLAAGRPADRAARAAALEGAR